MAPLGCGSGSTPDPKPAPPRPEAEVAPERFAKVVDEIRRRLKPSSQSPPVNVGGPLIAWKTTVSEELIPPPSEGLAWRGEITVATKSSVTVISAPQADDEDEVANDSRSTSDALFDSIETRSESEIEAALDELSASAGAASQSRTPVMQVIDDDEINVYKLIFEDRRWRLTTPLDEETEIGLIFRIALRSQ
ncbi:MAG: hypothetical protein AAGG46_10595 [Planctomycetota bacterium]